MRKKITVMLSNMEEGAGGWSIVQAYFAVQNM